MYTVGIAKTPRNAILQDTLFSPSVPFVLPTIEVPEPAGRLGLLLGGLLVLPGIHVE